jgi:putative transcriptional regulator
MNIMKNRIRELRAKYDITQEDLAKKVGVRRETIVFLERNMFSSHEVSQIKNHYR